MKTTHTYAILEISPAAYDEIRSKLGAAGYESQFHEDDGQEVIDMHGIAVRASEPEGPDEIEGLSSLAGVGAEPDLTKCPSNTKEMQTLQLCPKCDGPLVRSRLLGLRCANERCPGPYGGGP